MKYLLDTCIWRDFYENRISRSGKYFGLSSYKLFTKIINENHKIYFSESLIWELKIDYSVSEIKEMLNILFMIGVLVKVKIRKEDHIEAKKLSKERKIPFVDCLNAVQAKNNNCVLVSQDKHFFKNLNDICRVSKPESLV